MPRTQIVSFKEMKPVSARAMKAMQYFKDGYNCAQAVLLAFEDVMPLSAETLARIASSFGGGMGRLREVCGAFSGACLALGLLEGYSSPDAADEKAAQYARIQRMGAYFTEENGALICRTLMAGVEATPGGVPEKRDDAYYARRPCLGCIGSAADILARELCLQD